MISRRYELGEGVSVAGCGLGFAGIFRDAAIAAGAADTFVFDTGFAGV